VLVALLLLAWMMWQFSGAPFEIFAEPQTTVVFESQSAEGLGQGSSVEYRGVSVGRVDQVKRSADNRTVYINASVAKNPPLPGNVEGVIRRDLVGGASRISLELLEDVAQLPTVTATSKTTAPPQPVLQPQGAIREGQHIPARYVGTDILPREVTDLAADLRESSRALRRMLLQITDSELVLKLAHTVDSINDAVVKAGTVLDSVNTLVSDGKLRRDLSETMANFRAASESATRITASLEKTSANLDKRVDEVGGNANKLLTSSQAKIDDIAKSVGDRLIQVANVLDNFETASKRLNQGNGTAARLMNDPALYQNLLDASKELNLGLKDLRRVIEQWEKEGVPIKLGK
jgi:ABC-type transporter Mla subunit MlaD